ncbi:type I restriction enzyme, S subunit [Desulfomicrobium apsheronum]|uniref:Type I restriction enzyme, S subunit n=1 Tax=Desulfomicrobium apsheronum TaxID=52560 RepID=A0A1I3WUS3_9BACT|nr:restriction endonuclease subunit S [Desulfomicrobium apsheronum]SFK10607.1 type I restriction enzyme, S subunit [Desulfomicrobium apsheronum]
MSPETSWSRTTLGACASIKARIGWKGLHASEYQHEGYIFLATPNIKGPEIDFNDVNFISQRRYFESPELMLEDKDVLLVKDGSTLGISNLVRNLPGPATVNGSIAVIRCADRLVPAFLHQLTKAAAFQKLIHDKKSGLGVPHLFQADLRQFEITLPPVQEQSGVAQVLDTLDTVIHETEAIIAKLKAVKQGLLHDLLTRGIDANGELRPPQAEAPHLYKESLLGWIPKEWEFGALQTWLEGKPRNGYSPQEAGEWTGMQMLGLGCLTNEGFEPVQLKRAPRGDTRLAAAMLSDGDLLMSRSNTRDLVGLVGVYRDVGTPCTYPDLMMRLRPSPETSSEFLQFVLRSSSVRRQIQAHAVGTSGSMVKISGRIVCQLANAIPPKPEQERIMGCLAAADSRVQVEVEEVLVLRDLQAGLMDDLLTGRVRVTPLLEDPE